MIPHDSLRKCPTAQEGLTEALKEFKLWGPVLQSPTLGGVCPSVRSPLLSGGTANCFPLPSVCSFRPAPPAQRAAVRSTPLPLTPSSACVLFVLSPQPQKLPVQAVEPFARALLSEQPILFAEEARRDPGLFRRALDLLQRSGLTTATYHYEARAGRRVHMKPSTVGTTLCAAACSIDDLPWRGNRDGDACSVLRRRAST